MESSKRMAFSFAPQIPRVRRRVQWACAFRDSAEWRETINSIKMDCRHLHFEGVEVKRERLDGESAVA
jgi:hypothetical protein